MLRKFVEIAKLPLDLIFVVLAVPAGLILYSYRRVGSSGLKLTTAALKKIGVFPIRNHYLEPLFDDSLLKRPLSEPRMLPGIDFNEAGQLAFLQQLQAGAEIVAMQWDKPATNAANFSIINGSFESGDAEFLYQVLRLIKPKKVLEIGGGFSTKVMRHALLKNSGEGSQATQICIEPYEKQWLEQLDGIEVIRQKIEDCSFEWNKILEAGDLLFIDSSHVIRPQGDVLLEYLEILPQLASGVFIHIHDVFTPRDYLQEWVSQEVRLWNEQYLLEALLTNSNRYEVVAALNYLSHEHFNEMKRVCPYLTPKREPGSFYLRVR